MEVTATSVFALFTLLTVSSGVFLLATRYKIPYTVLLVAVGIILVFIAQIPGFGFLSEFPLTPELLFYVFLPILLFESSYNINITKLMENIKLISLLAVVGFFISAFAIAGILYGGSVLIGLPIPFFITLLFGALIASTDPVAVLALFKEFGAPRKLSLIFEGESLFNDGTAVALFIIVLTIIQSGYHGAETIIQGASTFIIMIAGGVLFGLFMGILFTYIIEKTKQYEFASITVTIAMAHLTFIASELISQHLLILEKPIMISPIIATVVASLFVGNYGRVKFSPKSEIFIEKFWAQSAFLANSLVFLLIGMLLANMRNLSIHLWIPMLIALVAVIIGRCVAIYPLVFLFNKTEDKNPAAKKQIPKSWQHLLAWGSLRGALAITLVLLIPENMAVAGWVYTDSVRDVLLALTGGTIAVSLFIQATTIHPLIRRWNIDSISDVEKIEYDESRALIHARVLNQLIKANAKGYIDNETFSKLKTKHAQAFTLWCNKRKEDVRSLYQGDTLATRVLRMHAIGIEKLRLKELYMYEEVTERVYKKLGAKLDVQLQSLELGTVPRDTSLENNSLDVFEKVSNWVHMWFTPSPEESIKNQYLYYRAQSILSRRVIKELKTFADISELSQSGVCDTKMNIFDEQALSTVVDVYSEFKQQSILKMNNVAESYPDIIHTLNERLAQKGLFKLEERILEELLRKEIISPKLGILLKQELAKENNVEHLTLHS
jgi:CPA1 family monovalent cation:H+ antiporter